MENKAIENFEKNQPFESVLKVVIWILNSPLYHKNVGSFYADRAFLMAEHERCP